MDASKKGSNRLAGRSDPQFSMQLLRFATVTTVKHLYATFCIQKIGFTRIKRMTLRAGVYVHLFNCGVDFHYIAACAADSGLTIFWMYIFFHFALNLFSVHQSSRTILPAINQCKDKIIVI